MPTTRINILKYNVNMSSWHDFWPSSVFWWLIIIKYRTETTYDHKQPAYINNFCSGVLLQVSGLFSNSCFLVLWCHFNDNINQWNLFFVLWMEYRHSQISSIPNKNFDPNKQTTSLRNVYGLRNNISLNIMIIDQQSFFLILSI